MNNSNHLADDDDDDADLPLLHTPFEQKWGNVLISKDPKWLEKLKANIAYWRVKQEQEKEMLQQQTRVMDMLESVTAGFPDNPAMRSLKDDMDRNLKQLRDIGDPNITEDQRVTAMLNLLNGIITKICLKEGVHVNLEDDDDDDDADAEKSIGKDDDLFLPNPLEAPEKTEPLLRTVRVWREQAKTDPKIAAKLRAYLQSIKTNKKEKFRAMVESFKAFGRDLDAHPELTQEEGKRLSDAFQRRQSFHATSQYSFAAQFNRAAMQIVTFIFELFGSARATTPGKTHLLLFPEIGQIKSTVEEILAKECGTFTGFFAFSAWASKYQEKLDIQDGLSLFGSHEQTHEWLTRIKAHFLWKKMNTTQKWKLFELLKPLIRSTTVYESLKNINVADELIGMLNDVMYDMKLTELGKGAADAGTAKRLKRALYARFTGSEHSTLKLMYYKLSKGGKQMGLVSEMKGLMGKLQNLNKPSRGVFEESTATSAKEKEEKQQAAKQRDEKIYIPDPTELALKELARDV